jgi:hypothetical protein
MAAAVSQSPSRDLRGVEGKSPVELVFDVESCPSARWPQFWSLWVRSGDRLELRDTGNDPLERLDALRCRVADLNGDGVLDVLPDPDPVHWLQKVGLLSTPAGYAMTSLRLPFPPVVKWSEPGD